MFIKLKPADGRRGSGEWHIAGVVVHAARTAVGSVARVIATLPNAHVHATSEEGKLVVTFEAARSSELADYMSLVQALPDVYAATLVYQHHADIASLNEEVHHGLDPKGVH